MFPNSISNFLEEIPSLSYSIVFLYFFSLITEEGFLMSPCYSLELYIQMGISFLFSFAFHFSSFQAICKASSDSHFAFCISFPWGWSWSLSPVQCHEPPYIVLQALCLSDLIPWIYLSLPLYNRKGFDLGHGQGGLVCCDSWGLKESDTTEWLNWTELNGLVVFPTFFSLSPTLTLSTLCSTQIERTSPLWFVTQLGHLFILIYFCTYCSYWL